MRQKEKERERERKREKGKKRERDCIKHRDIHESTNTNVHGNLSASAAGCYNNTSPKFREKLKLAHTYQKCCGLLLLHLKYTINWIHISVLDLLSHRNNDGQHSATIMIFVFAMTSMKRCSSSCPSGAGRIPSFLPRPLVPSCSLTLGLWHSLTLSCYRRYECMRGSDAIMKIIYDDVHQSPAYISHDSNRIRSERDGPEDHRALHVYRAHTSHIATRDKITAVRRYARGSDKMCFSIFPNVLHISRFPSAFSDRSLVRALFASIFRIGVLHRKHG